MLELKNLHIGYGKHKLLENINLSVEKNTLIAVIGLNGTGKSTLLKTIVGLVKPLNGSIIIKSQDIRSYPAKELAKIISFASAYNITASNLTVENYVGLGRLPYINFTGLLSENDKKIIKEALEIIGITSLKDRDLNKISDGQKQKANIAKLLAQQTDIMLLDEPTAFLDIKAKIDFFKLFKKIATELNKIIILSTHDLQFAINFADEIWLISDKKIICGSPNHLLKEKIFSKIFGEENIIFNNFTANIDV